MATPVRQFSSGKQVTASTNSAADVTFDATVAAGEVLTLEITSPQGMGITGTPTFNGDAAELVVQNVVNSARIYMYKWLTPDVGTFQVAWRPADDGMLAISSAESWSGVDTGAGGTHNTNTSTGTSQTPNIDITSADNEIALAAFCSRSFTPMSWTDGDQIWIHDPNNLGAGLASLADQATASFAASVGAADDDWSMAGYSLIGASDAADPRSDGKIIIRGTV